MRGTPPSRAASLVVVAGLLSACHDTCLLVVGCKNADRVAVEGRIVQTESGVAVAGVKLTLIASTATSAESTKATSDAEGLFSLVLPVGAIPPATLALRVVPPRNPEYTISPLDCKPASTWGNACVLNPIVTEPTPPIFKFVYRNDVGRDVANVTVTFQRTGGSALVGPKANTLFEITTDEAGTAFLFPPGVRVAGMEPVLGDLTVYLPDPIGTTVRHNYGVQPTARFNSRSVNVQLTGPTLEYLLIFTDSATGRRLPGVDVRYQRIAGVATNTESFRVSSNSDGLAFFQLTPLAQGTITGDFSITPPRSSVTTRMNGVSLKTFDADSSIVLARLRVGVTGTLYAIPPGGP